MQAKDVKAQLASFASPERAKSSAWFFKTGAGQYGEGDEFIGVNVPDQRRVAKQFVNLPLNEAAKLLASSVHEHRLTALIILVAQYKVAADDGKQRIYDFYLAHAGCVNNWDLVDSSASYIVGAHLFDKDRSLLYDLAYSASLWERRIAIIATAYFIARGESNDTFAIAEILLTDTHDLIHKAVGWMLREVGKSCGQEVEEEFLHQYYKKMPRTMLRYSIERFSPERRQQYLKGLI